MCSSDLKQPKIKQTKTEEKRKKSKSKLKKQAGKKGDVVDITQIEWKDMVT